MISDYVYLLILSSIISIEGAGLYGKCLKSEECGTLDTFCNNGTCLCKENFTPNVDTCVELPIPRISCKQKSECHSKLGSRSTCKNSQCSCRQFHHIYYNTTHKNGQCVKNKDLDESCDFDHQCYCGQDCNDNIGCIDGVCKCRPDCKRYGRRCVCPKKDIKTTTEKYLTEEITSPTNETPIKEEEENYIKEATLNNSLFNNGIKLCSFLPNTILTLCLIVTQLKNVFYL